MVCSPNREIQSADMIATKAGEYLQAAESFEASVNGAKSGSSKRLAEQEDASTTSVTPNTGKAKNAASRSASNHRNVDLGGQILYGGAAIAHRRAQEAAAVEDYGNFAEPIRDAIALLEARTRQLSSEQVAAALYTAVVCVRSDCFDVRRPTYCECSAADGVA